jgi:pumilio RNA-binding family
MICLNDHNGKTFVVGSGKYFSREDIERSHLDYSSHLAQGNHVIQKSISILFKLAKEAREKGEHEMCSFYLDSLDPIVEEIIASVEMLSQHPYGCRAVQRMVEHCIEPQRTKILDSIIACQQNILSHTYGNYVVQKVLAFGRTSDKDAIFRDIVTNNNFIMLSRQKQASNVVEAMLRLGDANQRLEIVQAMMNVSLHVKVFSICGVMQTSATY